MAMADAVMDCADSDGVAATAVDGLVPSFFEGESLAASSIAEPLECADRCWVVDGSIVDGLVCCECSLASHSCWKARKALRPLLPLILSTFCL